MKSLIEIDGSYGSYSSKRSSTGAISSYNGRRERDEGNSHVKAVPLDAKLPKTFPNAEIEFICLRGQKYDSPGSFKNLYLVLF